MSGSENRRSALARLESSPCKVHLCDAWPFVCVHLGCTKYRSEFSNTGPLGQVVPASAPPTAADRGQVPQGYWPFCAAFFWAKF